MSVIKPEDVPDDVWKAAKAKWLDPAIPGTEEAAREAVVAMLNAWPGSEYVFRQPHRLTACYSKPAIILPLTENSNDKT